MIRWPYKFRRIEGKRSSFKLFRGMAYAWYRWDLLCENLYIKKVHLPRCGVYQGKPRVEKVVASLTTFPARINQAYYAIKSLMLQTYRPDRIVLWLSEKQFPDKKLPVFFDDLISRGLEIRFTPDDLRSHKKYYYMLQEQQPDELVITYDDDIIYEADSIEKLIKKHRSFPNCIVCNRGEHIQLDKKNHLAPYRQWKIHSEIGVDRPAYAIVPSTGAGCLYPYNIMPDSTFNKEEILKLAFSADDLWMRFNSLCNKVKVIKSQKENAILCVVNGSQIENLSKMNCIDGENDRAIERLVSRFPECVTILREE